MIFTAHYFRATLPLKEAIGRFAVEISAAKEAMRASGNMTRPFQDLGTKNLFLILMQLTAGMGNKAMLREEVLRGKLPVRLRNVSPERIRLCKEALIATEPAIYLDVYGDDALEIMVDVILIASRLYCFMIGQHEHPVSEKGKASKFGCLKDREISWVWIVHVENVCNGGGVRWIHQVLRMHHGAGWNFFVLQPRFRHSNASRRGLEHCTTA
jgi:hypothetical protein